jgi:peptidoglycan/LPS O-acetylase OafA/YrhL
MHADKHRVPCLDGLRAISISLVLLDHLPGCSGFPISLEQEHAWKLSGVGTLGVGVFFVISGYLITTLLLRELTNRGGIDLGKFYFRRTLRIFPAYFALVGLVGGLAAAGVIQLLPGDLLHAVTYTMNYHSPRAWWLGHAWSLAVEEQFYLLWPAVLLLFGRERGLYGALAVVAPFRSCVWDPICSGA